MKLVTLAQASAHLRRDTTADDEDLELKVEGASAAVMNYLKRAAWPKFFMVDTSGDVLLDTDGMPLLLVGTTMPKEIQAATLLMTGYLYKDRDDDSGGQYEHGFLPAPITAILYPLRKPAVA